MKAQSSSNAKRSKLRKAAGGSRIPFVENFSNPKVRLKRTRNRGQGVFALRRIHKGEVIGVFDGRVFDTKYDGWTEDQLNHVIQISPNQWRDSNGIARYLNHSCDPNCGVRGRFKIVTMRNIEPGEELTWDYEMTEMNNFGWRMSCRCNTDMCRGTIGHYRNMPKDVRERYGSYISCWIRLLRQK